MSPFLLYMNCITQLKNFNMPCRATVGGIKHVLLDLSGINHIYNSEDYTYETNLSFNDFYKNIIELPYNCYSTGLVSTSVHNNKANYSVTALNLTINSFDIYNFNELKNSKPILYYQTNNGEWGVMTKSRVTSSTMQTGVSRTDSTNMKLTFTETDLYVKECGEKLINNLEQYLEGIIIPDNVENLYLTLHFTESGTITIPKSNYHVFYMMNNDGHWNDTFVSENKIVVGKNSTLSLRIDNTYTPSGSLHDVIKYINKNFILYGNLAKTDEGLNHSFELCKDNKYIINADGVVIKDITYKYAPEADFEYMFANTNITSTPNIADWYDELESKYPGEFTIKFNHAFENTRITTANVKLHGDNISTQYMFNNCKQLESAKLSLDGITGSHTTFNYMFNGCSNLDELTLIGKTSEYVNKGATESWVRGVHYEGTAYVDDQTWLTTPRGISTIPPEWNISILDIYDYSFNIEILSKSPSACFIHLPWNPNTGAVLPVTYSVNNEPPIINTSSAINLNIYPVGTKIRMWGNTGKWNSFIPAPYSPSKFFNQTAGNKFRISGQLGALLSATKQDVYTTAKGEFQNMFGPETEVYNLELPVINEPADATFGATFEGANFASPMVIPEMPLSNDPECSPFSLMFARSNISTLYIYSAAPKHAEYQQWLEGVNNPGSIAYVKDNKWSSIVRGIDTIPLKWRLVAIQE